MQHSNTTINQSNNKKQKVKQEAEAVQSSSIDDIKLPAVQSLCDDDIQLPLGIELPPHPFAMDYPDTAGLQCTYFLTNERLMLMLPSNLKTTKYHINGHSYTVLELDQIDDMEEVGYQKNYNDNELAFITPLLQKYMPNYEVDNYSKPKLIKSTNPSKADDGWEYESRTYKHADNDPVKQRMDDILHYYSVQINNSSHHYITNVLVIRLQMPLVRLSCQH